MKKNINFVFFFALIVFSGCLVPKHTAITNTKGKLKGGSQFLFISDIHLNTLSDTTDYNLDTGTGLWKIFLTKVDSILGGANAPSFAVYTGDLPGHYSCASDCYLEPGSRESHNRDLTTILKGLRELFTRHHTPFFYVPGNNDALAGDYYSFADKQNMTPFSLVPDSMNPYPALNVNQTGNTAPCMVSNSHPTMGYYSARPVDGLRLIGLNTVMYSKNFIAVDGTNQTDDGNAQMEWLGTELKDARDKGEKVLITMHIPPGNDAYKYGKNPANASMWVRNTGPGVSWENRFLSLIDQYQNSVSGILYGHTHMDEIRRLYDSTGNQVTAVAISCPGVTPQHNNNPGFKLVLFDKINKELIDFTTFYTLPSAVAWGNLTYSFNNQFGFPLGQSLYKNVRSSSLSDLSRKMSRIYTVMHGQVKYDIAPGIEVKYGQ